ncbi:Hemolysin, chromosomal [Synechococcus sp. MIT S9509]|uniref:calcium-binding protein n=1 Tax=Synechococcus sp. MIT S9509 TaxID=1801630 RepID=UPI0007BB5DC9|nr:calcium-binding protein [Synechococcus sp. MIT S9509]KZR89221.1 Hemolysin, chromosomal [Synechococcus sp. MIT S9509]
MASFKTLKGPGGSDRIGATYVGSDSVDNIVFEGNASDFFLGAEPNNDFIAFNNVNALSTGTFTNGTIRGGSGNDTIAQLNAGADHVGAFYNGNKGNDFIGSRVAGVNANNSTIQGGQGDDTVNTGNGTGTVFNGNKGTDTVTIAGVVTASTIGGGQGNDTLGFTAVGTTSQTSWFLGLGDDTLTEGVANGFLGGNTIDGGDGADTLTMNVATTASVTVTGGKGNDNLTTGSGEDRVNGGVGNDTITGGFDNDQLTGGGGRDIFNYANNNEVFNGNSNSAQAVYDASLAAGTVDVLTDFTSGTDAIQTTNAQRFNAVNETFNLAGAANGYATYALANTAATNRIQAQGNDRFAMTAVGSAGSWTSYLFAAGNDGSAWAIQIGETGAFATVAQAQRAVVINDLIV